MKRDRTFSQSCLSLLSLSSLIWLATTPPSFAQFARLYSVRNGIVELKRPNWSAFYRAYPRTMLTGDDLLDVAVGADVFLLCPDGFVSDAIQTGVSNVGATCVGTPRSVRPSFEVSETWAATDEQQPYVISPWSEQVRTGTPILRWNPVDGAQQYTVTLLRRAGETWEAVWTATSEQTEMDYPADEPPLEEGREYSLQVFTAEDTTATESPLASFRLLDGFDQAPLAEKIAEIEAFPVDDVTKTLILVEEVYPRYKLFPEGINQLTALVEAGHGSDRIYRLLGDYYIRSGLVLPTEESYLSAIELAKESNHLEEQVMAAWGLGTLYSRTEQPQAACTYLNSARQLAMDLSDTNLVASIEKEIERLQSNNS
ncbi:MAG: hypothetical protein AAFQ74_02875 [Cyanobacteria bacterium J06623_4]